MRGWLCSAHWDCVSRDPLAGGQERVRGQGRAAHGHFLLFSTTDMGNTGTLVGREATSWNTDEPGLSQALTPSRPIRLFRKRQISSMRRSRGNRWRKREIL